MTRNVHRFLPGLCLTAMLAAGHAPLALAQDDSLAQGAGTHTCAQMYEQSKRKWQSNRQVAPFYQSWFHGILSGMNVSSFAHVAKRRPFVIRLQDLRQPVRSCCDDNPDEDLLTVAVKLYYSRDLTGAQ